MGGAVNTVTDAIADVVEPVIDTVKDVGSDVDDFVNEEIPGGWYTVGAVAGGTALANSGVLGGAAASTAPAVEIGAASTAVPGSLAAALPELGVAQAAGATALPGTFAAETAGLLGTGGAIVAPVVSQPLMSATEAAASNIDPAVLETMSQEQVAQAAINSPYYAAAQSNIDPALLEGMSAAEVASSPVLTSAVLPETLAVPASIGLKDAMNAVRGANALRNLLGQPTAKIPPMHRQMFQPQGSVQYPSLSLLEMRPIQRPTTLI